MSDELIGEAGERCIICEAEVFLTTYRWQKTPANEKPRSAKNNGGSQSGQQQQGGRGVFTLAERLSLGFVLLLNYWQKSIFGL